MEDVLLSVEDAGVAKVTLNRAGARNALSLSVNERMRELAATLGADPSVRAIVLSGAGDKAFCAGADLKERKGVTAEQTGPYVDAISGMIRAWAELPKPTICALNGPAFGGGLELALACDFRIAVRDARFALSEVRLGILPGAGGTQRLPRLVGVAHAKELILLGRAVSADKALAIGLVHEVVERDALEQTVASYLAEVASCAPVSYAKAKEAIERGVDVPLADGLAIERACYDVTLFTEDRNEGLRAFAEKRPPRFLGK